jgi:glycerophosphoryl diester phosphodiesterase
MNYLMEEISVINTVHYKGVFSAELYDNSIIEVKWNPELKEIEKQHLMALTKAVKELGNEKKMRVYITTFDFMSINEESRKYSSTLAAERYTLANAVLIDSLAKKILFNFYLKFNKPNVPTRAFQLKSQAFEWLLSIED